MSRQKTSAKSEMLVFRRRPGSGSIFNLFYRTAEKILSEKSAKSASAKTR